MTTININVQCDESMVHHMRQVALIMRDRIESLEKENEELRRANKRLRVLLDYARPDR